MYDTPLMISNHGRLQRKDGSRTYGSPDSKSRKLRFVHIVKGGPNKTFMIHMEVARHFIENPDNKRRVRHKDGDISNNHYTNLEWY